MWYITERSKTLDITTDPCFTTFGEARDKAEELYQSSGKHYHVTKVQFAWTTTRGADIFGKRKGD